MTKPQPKPIATKAQQIIDWVSQDPLRQQALACVSQLNLPQGYIAAGFVRNLVWDALHHYTEPTPLNDVDVIYFDPAEDDPETCEKYESQLQAQVPQLNWQVRNQARMHVRNGDRPYQSVLDAMSFWVEKETAVAIRQIAPGHYECIAAFGLVSLFRLQVTYNSKRSGTVFEDRLRSKNWLQQWPKLTVVQ
ncbi:nucleotidyltransferase family protein [Photobacterium atrarenae]|uniref:Nucleotidyltransferase family protein n=1 Tax=Photobacterium atrarenae TaxID=865757 RepID=A0ABY5GL17_9GAMM|nr:nucleotidyltransferase family protein [Photobacterium atrarenae]UTV29836.1 nucleotidyltransferase family protein [Photobacterium atrarenae]